MAVYVKKPIPVEAIQFDPFNGFNEDTPIWLSEAIESGNVVQDIRNGCFVVRTLEGNMTAYSGDYIIRGVGGELYPCRGDIFDETYEEVIF